MSFILVIEDDRTQRLLAVAALKQGGHEVVEADDGMQGLQLARVHKPDLIVCDVMMPGMNGYQIVTALREEEGISDIPVIMLTAMTERAHMRIAMTSGADDYLAKPFSIKELNEAAAALIAKRKAQREGFVNAIKTELIEALDEQKQQLAAQYERRFVKELSSRWERGGQASDELKYDDATLLMVDLFGSVLSQMPSGTETGEIVRRAYQSARDTLYLFGAQHLLSYGNDLLAVFVDPPKKALRVSPKLRAVRAACTLVKSISTLLSSAVPALADPGAANHVAVALHQGPITLLHVHDPLHGDPAATLAAGETFDAVKALREFAQGSHWRVACSRKLLEGITETMRTGQTGALAAGPLRPALEAVEILEAA